MHHHTVTKLLFSVAMVLEQQMLKRPPAFLEMGHRAALSEGQKRLQIYLKLLWESCMLDMYEMCASIAISKRSRFLCFPIKGRWNWSSPWVQIRTTEYFHTQAKSGAWEGNT